MRFVARKADDKGVFVCELLLADGLGRVWWGRFAFQERIAADRTRVCRFEGFLGDAVEL